ncbi:hypothetical protein [Heyndrickxia vini]|uniref:Uncharacterized protein n=1 Tax=Heyndrickxia vini TaxID=1476025 RepID=A0ABX7DXM0_9BACI|nr:hypothetical protein [Heyndrickxia vini]QQZ08057.1 hypothetical protein I5776_13315 [Heyndrickxia vini]
MGKRKSSPRLATTSLNDVANKSITIITRIIHLVFQIDKYHLSLFPIHTMW